MRTRSGFTLGKRRSGQDAPEMAEDIESTDAQWGTPAHTASFSTIDSHPRSPPALSPVVENQQSRSDRSAFRVHSGGDGQDTLSYPQPAQSRPPPHAVRDGSSQQSRHHRPLRSNQPRHYNDKMDEEDDRSQAHHSSTSREVMRRYSQEERPWNHTIAGEKRTFSDAGQEQHPSDRNYPDKMEKELEELEKGVDDKDSDGSPKKHKNKKVRRSRGKGYDRTAKGNRKETEHDSSEEDGKVGVRA